MIAVDRLAGQRLVVGPAEPQRVGVGDVGGGHLRAPARRWPTRRARRGVDLVVDVGDVVTSVDAVALVLEEPLEQREDDERPRVADVDPAVDGRPAGVDAHAAAGRGSSGRSWPVRVSCRRIVAQSVRQPTRRQCDSDPAVRVRLRPPCRRERLVRTQRLEAVDEAFRIAPRALPRRRPGLRRHLPRHASATSGTPGRSAARAHAARVRKGGTTRRAPDVDDRHRRRHVAARCATASSPASRPSSAACYAARATSTSPIAFEGMFRLPDGRPPLLRDPRHRRSGRTASRPSRWAAGRDVLLLHGLGGTRASFFETAAALAGRLPRPRARPARLRRVLASPRPAPTTPRWFAEIMLGPDGRAAASTARTSSATRWAAAWRSRSASSRPSASARSACCVRPSRSSSARCTRSSASCAPSSACCPTRFPRSAVAGAVLELFSDRDLIDPAVGRPGRRRVPARSTTPPARATRSWPRRATSTSRRRSGATGFYRAPGRPPGRRRCSSGAAHDRLIPPAFCRHVREWLPRAEQVDARRLRPRAAGRAARADQRLLLDFFARAERSAAAAASGAAAAGAEAA